MKVGGDDYRSDGDPAVTIPVLLEEVNFKKNGVQAKLVFLTDDRATWHALVDAKGHHIQIVVGPAREPELPLGGRAEEAAPKSGQRRRRGNGGAPSV